MNVVVACGGTGGHLFPGIAVAEELRDRGHPVMLLVSEKRVDRTALEGTHHMAARALPSVAWRGARPDRALKFIFGVALSWRKVARIYREFRPDVVLGMGGFSCVAPLLAARWAGIPSIIHESNAIPGKANRWAARFVTRVAVGLEGAQNNFCGGRAVWTGTPVRQVLRLATDAAAARQRLGLAEGIPVALVMGGSQGARGLNRLVISAAERLGRGAVQWIHLAGEEHEAEVRTAYENAGLTAHVFGFCHDMETAYAAADFAIARSGAASLTEIAHVGLPSILVPYPLAADRHQSANARLFAEAGAALVAEEAELLPEALADLVERLRGDPARREAMRRATKKLRHEDAHRRLAGLVEQMGGTSR